MKCTNCGGDIKDIQVGKHTIKKCTKCHGILITDNNLMEILHKAHELDTTKKKKKDIIKKPKTQDEFISKLNCHICGIPMENYEYMYSSGIRIDRCPGCSTIWLDSGKLLLIHHYINHLEEYDYKIKELIPKMVDIQREVEETFQQIKEDSNIYKFIKGK